MQSLYDTVCERVNCTSADHRHNIDYSSVKHSTSKLKGGKNEGFDVLSSDYILNDPELLCHHLSSLFSLMLSHCCAPTSFGTSTMIPIPKCSGSMGDIKNYRGIALSSLLSKLFDTCNISSQFNSLLSNDLQFANKSQTSTIQCVSSFMETVSYHIGHLGHTYMCMLDVSKAFDRVNLLLLFHMLLQRDMCPLFLRFLMSTYCNQQMRVRWNGTTSNTFSTSNGVKQGGVLSPIMFNVYINELILLFSEQGIGCHLHGQFVGTFICADDVSLLAPTSTALNAMLETCSNFASDFDLQFNSSKTKCMYFSKNNQDAHDNIYFMNTPIEFMKSTQLLGVHISNDITNKNITIVYISIMPELTVSYMILEMYLVMLK